MKIEDQVTSLELAKRLKELGVKQDSLFSWVQRGDTESDWSSAFLQESRIAVTKDYATNGWCSAFTVAELGAMLPENSKCTKARSEWLIEQYGHEFGAMENTEADARAKMLIYLLEKNS